MPPPLPVELQPYSPEWAVAPAREIRRLTPVLGGNLVFIYHIGSTAVPGVSAKPILDLMPVVTDLSKLDECRPAIEALGYEWWGEYGLTGRRYCTLDDPETARRKVQLHCFREGTHAVHRHLAFRDYLRARPDLAQIYDALKARCRHRYPLDSCAYSKCKEDWIRQIEAEAMSFYQSAPRD